MRKTAVTLSLVLLFLVGVGATSVNLARANPAPLFSFPTEPITTPPTIIVNSPVQNQTYNTTVEFSLTIIKPETWFAIDVGSHLDGSPINQAFVNVTSVYYAIDDGERQNITLHDITSLWDTTPTMTLNLSTALPMAAGAHTLKVGLEADSYYVVRYTYNFSDALASVKLHAETAPLNFRVATDLEIQLESLPIVPIAASVAAIAIVSIGSLIFFKKRKH
jgi:hypothetical protein